jgi:2-polyprenyl-6-methoxyphenol hydroxylase-like FAD-dependent oxidoreductase
MEDRGRVVGVRISTDAHEQEVRARLVIGADGSSSTVRPALDIPYLSRSYDESYFVIDLDRPKEYEDALRIELHPSGGVLVVPGPDRVGVAALVRSDEEPLFRAGSLPDKLAALARRSNLLKGRTPFPGSHLYKLSRGHVPHYVARGAALIGDAAHVTNPTAAQGMTMAIEDARSLSRLVGPALVSGASGAALDPLLVEYERERRPINERWIRHSHWMAHFYALGGRFGNWIQRRTFAFGSSTPGKMIQQAVWRRVAVRD